VNAASFDTQLLQALAEFQAGEFGAAATLVDTLLAGAPGHSDLLHLAASIALRQQRMEPALQFARGAVAADRDNNVFRFTFAQALSALQRHEEAMGELREILRINPHFLMAHMEIWNIMKSLGRRHELIGLVKARLGELDDGTAGVPVQAKVKIHDTTLCCIDCSSHAAAIRALRVSQAGCDFARTVFLTDRDFKLASVETIIIEPIRSLHEYSDFVMKRLLHHINTKYLLVIQWDGYVVNPAAWSADFQRFDYIGARLPFLPGGRSVGNGGFSLRSRRLLEVLQDPRFSETHPEDLKVCQTYRDTLEQEFGIKFAPEDVADRFAFELAEPVTATFGFHNPRNITRFVDDTAIRLLQIEAAAH
jgi:hypothetical protein